MSLPLLNYARLYPGLDDHPKLLKAASLVSAPACVDREAEVGWGLVRVWLYAVAHAPDGVLDSVAVVERAIGGRRGKAVASALIDVGLLDLGDDGCVVIHGWTERYGDVVDERERKQAQWREQKRRRRTGGQSATVPQDVRRTSAGHPPEVHQDIRENSAGIPRSVFARASREIPKSQDPSPKEEQQVHEPVGLPADATSPEAHPPKATRRRPNPEANPAVARLIAAYATAYESRHGEKPVIDGGKLGALLKRRLRAMAEPDLEALILAGLASPVPFFDGGLAAILSDVGLEKLRAEQRRSHGGNGASADPAYQRDLAAHGQEIATFLAGERKRGRA